MRKAPGRGLIAPKSWLTAARYGSQVYRGELTWVRHLTQAHLVGLQELCQICHRAGHKLCGHHHEDDLRVLHCFCHAACGPQPLWHPVALQSHSRCHSRHPALRPATARTHTQCLDACACFPTSSQPIERPCR